MLSDRAAKVYRKRLAKKGGIGYNMGELVRQGMEEWRLVAEPVVFRRKGPLC